MAIASKEFVLSEVHALNDVSAVTKHSANVFSVHRACEVRVAVVSAVGLR